MSSKRIAKELAECAASPPAGMVISLANDTDLHHWQVVLTAPASSIYAGGTYGIAIELPVDYPFKPPVVRFVTRIYHPNVTNDSLGNICLATLKSETWKPATRLSAVLESVRQLLLEPQPDDPLEARIADEFKTNRKEFDKNAKLYVVRYAKEAKPEFGDGGKKK